VPAAARSETNADLPESVKDGPQLWKARDPATALVVIDMVPFFVSGNPYCRGIVPNINHIADTLRAAGGTVAWVLPAAGERTPVLDEFFGPETAEAYRTLRRDRSAPERLWPELVVRPGDVLVEKSAASAFFPGRCRLPKLLEERGSDQGRAQPRGHGRIQRVGAQELADLRALSERARRDYEEHRAVWHANLGPLRTPQMRAVHEDLDDMSIPAANCHDVATWWALCDHKVPIERIADARLRSTLRTT
jgi:hypothetical protein